jgi:hypothetical protein
MTKRLPEETLFFRAKGIKQLLKSPTGGSATYSWTWNGQSAGSMRYTVFADNSCYKEMGMSLFIELNRWHPLSDGSRCYCVAVL